MTTHGVHVIKIEGQFLGNTADRWLQVHDSDVAAAEGAVPLKQWLISQTSPFFQSFPAGELAVFRGLYICVSNTAGTKTLSADTMDLGVELTDPELPAGTSYAGDESTPRTTLLVWGQAAGQKTLFRIIVTERSAVDEWLFIYCDDLKAKGVAMGPFKIPASTTRVLSFGLAGIIPQIRDVAGNYFYGCSIVIATSPTDPNAQTGSAAVRVEYK